MRSFFSSKARGGTTADTSGGADTFEQLKVNKDEIKRKGRVKNWLEAVVLMSDNDRFTTPLPELSHQARVTNNPLVAAGVITPPFSSPGGSMSTMTAHTRSRGANSSSMSQLNLLDRKNTPVLAAYEQLPTPQTPKLILANERQAYDNALDEQLANEISKLEQVQAEAFASADEEAGNRAVAQQQAIVDQLRAQKEMVMRQKQQQQHHQPKKSQHKLPPLEDRLRGYFQHHDAAALVDGRFERIFYWACNNRGGEDELNAMLRKQFGGTDLQQWQQDLDDRIAKLASRLQCFYREVGAVNMAQEPECQKIARWAVTQPGGVGAGEQLLNEKLRKKYGEDEDLATYAARVHARVADRLRVFYEQHNPQMMRERGIGPLLQWTVDNGVPALNDLLLEKYGVDLDGRTPAAPVDDGWEDLEV